MHRLKLLVIDLVLIALATVLALVLRDNFDVSMTRLEDLVPYAAMTLAGAVVVLPLLGISRSIWRFTTMADYVRLMLATLIIVVAAMAACFSYNRLDGLPRALPVLQMLIIVAALVGVRVLARLRRTVRSRPAQLVVPLESTVVETVLVVGLTSLTDLYLHSLAEMAADRVRVAGLLGHRAQHTGRYMHRHRILGTPDQVAAALRELEVHGVFVDRIVVTLPVEKLSMLERDALRAVEKLRGIPVEYIAEQMGLSAAPQARASAARVPAVEAAAAFTVRADDLAAMARRPYWRFKRVLDVVAAAALLLVLWPLLLLASLLALIDVGLPLAFWQQRPGLGGVPFRLYKLRTMRSAYDTSGRLLADSERQSRIGWFLRRTRLDELPQLINVLKGEMSFIGPRPLLPADQPAAYAARLLVRPGLTGWAQVKAGRDVSAANKAALDVWYVHNASLALDFEILLRTVHMLVFGETLSTAAIRLAWRDLQRAGICSASEMMAAKGVFDRADGATGAKSAA